MVGEQVLEHYGDKAKFGRIQAHCALAQYSITLARTEQDINKRNTLLNDASKDLSRAQNEDEHEQLVHLGFGLLESAKGNPQMAGIALAKAKKKLCNGQPNVAADIALAQVRPATSTCLPSCTPHLQLSMPCYLACLPRPLMAREPQAA